MKRSVKLIAVLSSFLIVAAGMFGCGNKASEEVTITSKWELVEFSVNGKVTNTSGESFLFKLMTDSSNPKFVCNDGVNCVFSLGKKKHRGKITEQDGIYIIDFDDSYKNMTARIDGDNLILTNESETLEITFVAR